MQKTHRTLSKCFNRIVAIDDIPINIYIRVYIYKQFQLTKQGSKVRGENPLCLLSVIYIYIYRYNISRCSSLVTTIATDSLQLVHKYIIERENDNRQKQLYKELGSQEIRTQHRQHTTPHTPTHPHTHYEQTPTPPIPPPRITRSDIPQPLPPFKNRTRWGYLLILGKIHTR